MAATEQALTSALGARKPRRGHELYHDLLEAYGPTMAMSDVAAVLQRSTSSLRNLIAGYECGQGNRQPWVGPLAVSRVRAGRKVIFPTRVVASVLSQEQS